MRAEVMRKTESERQEKMEEVLKHELDVKKLKEKMEEEQRAEREKLDAEWEELRRHQEMFKEVTIAVDRVKRKHKERWQVAASSSQNPPPQPDDDDPPGANLGNEQVGVLEDNESDSHTVMGTITMNRWEATESRKRMNPILTVMRLRERIPPPPPPQKMTIMTPTSEQLTAIGTQLRVIATVVALWSQ